MCTACARRTRTKEWGPYAPSITNQTFFFPTMAYVDNDQIPNGWERTYYGSPTGTTHRRGYRWRHLLRSRGMDGVNRDPTNALSCFSRGPPLSRLRARPCSSQAGPPTSTLPLL